MTTLHDKLKALGPVSFSSVPIDQFECKKYLQDHFSAAQFIIESVPQPSSQPATINASQKRTRAASSASALSDISHSSARSETPTTEHEQLQKDWGKPMKLPEKENPLGISVYKLPSKDGRGAWFARRSVHEGLSFERWKEGLMQEFPSSLKVEGGPGSGKIRGIAADTRPEQLAVEGVGNMEVYHLSAQFPGPSAPRDFVTLLLTSDSALSDKSPRHYMVISKPCEHPNYPAKNPLVRGTYESIEFIREVPRSKKAASMTNLPRPETQTEDDLPVILADTPGSPGRARGKTIGFAETRGLGAKGESIDLQDGLGDAIEEESHPVEWIMISRSDPGGSVPRFLVERGTPAGIVADASKFLDWACKREPSSSFDDSASEVEDTPKGKAECATPVQETADSSASSQSLLSTVAHAAYTTAETYAPNVSNGILNATSVAPLGSSDTSIQPTSSARSPSLSSNDSFASAEEDFSDVASQPSNSGSARKLSAQEKELLKLADRKSELAEKLRRAKEKSIRDRDNPTEKELSNVKKAQEKYDREITKAEERYAKATKQIEDRRRRDESKEEELKQRDIKREVERREKTERKEREQKEKQEKRELESRLKVEIEALKKEAGKLKSEKDGLTESVHRLQAENTKLVTLIGKLEGGPRLLQELRGDSSGGDPEGNVGT